MNRQGDPTLAQLLDQGAHSWHKSERLCPQQYTQRASHLQPQPFGMSSGQPFVNDDEVGVQFLGQRDYFGLTSIQISEQISAPRVLQRHHANPARRLQFGAPMPVAPPVLTSDCTAVGTATSP
jgi:hypothetical protein